MTVVLEGSSIPSHLLVFPLGLIRPTRGSKMFHAKFAFLLGFRTSLLGAWGL